MSGNCFLLEMRSLDYQTAQFKLHEALVLTNDILTQFGSRQSDLAEIRDSLDVIREKRFVLAVVGDFKRGKTSLINALLGSSILPTDVKPTTAAVNRITYGVMARASILFKDGSREVLPSVSVLADYVTKLDSEKASVASNVQEAILEYPAMLCINHVDIVDTPGLGDENDMTAITLSALDTVDAAIVTIMATSPFSETEAAMVGEVIACDKIHLLVFVVSCIDLISPEDQDRLLQVIRERVTVMVPEYMEKKYGEKRPELIKKAEDILREFHLFGVSAKQALRSFTANDQSLLEKSRFDTFKNELMAVVTANQGKSAIRKANEVLKKGIAHIYEAAAKLKEAPQCDTDDSRRELQQIMCDYDEKERKILSTWIQISGKLIGSKRPELENQDKELRKIFLQELGKLRSAEKKEVNNALTAAGLTANRAMQDYMKKLLNEFASSFEEAAIVPWRELHLSLCNRLAPYVDNEPLIADALRQLERFDINDVQLDVRFAWADALMMQKNGGGSMELIRHVDRVIKQSLSSCIKRLEEELKRYEEQLRTLAGDEAPLHTRFLNEVQSHKKRRAQYRQEFLGQQLDTLAPKLQKAEAECTEIEAMYK